MSKEVISQLDEAKKLLSTDIESYLDPILLSTLTISTKHDNKDVIEWCLSFFISLISMQSSLSLKLKLTASSKILSHFVSDPLSFTDYYSTLLPSYLTMCCDLIRLSALDIAFNNKKDVLLADVVKLKDSIISKFREQKNHSNINATILFLRFIFIVIQIQSSHTQEVVDPRKRRKLENTNVFEMDIHDAFKKTSLINDKLHIEQSLMTSMSEESKNLLAEMLRLFEGTVAEPKDTNCQQFSAICFLLGDLVVKRTCFNEVVLTSILKLDLDIKEPPPKVREITNYNKLNYKLSKRFDNRALRNLIDILFKRRVLIFFKKSEINDQNLLNEREKLSLQFLDKINSILTFQNEERIHKNLLDDLPHDKPLIISKPENKAEKIPLLNVYNIFKDDNLKFNLKELNNDTIIKNMIISALRKVSVEDLTERLQVIGKEYISLSKKAQGDSIR